MPLKILTIDDHPLMREALSLALSTEDDRYAVRGVATLQEGLDVLRTERIDVVLLDLSLPGCSGNDALRALRDEFPHVRTAIVSAHDDARTILSCLEAGAVGYIPKTVTREVLTDALRRVLEGGTYVPTQAVVGAAEPAPAPLLPRMAGHLTDPRDLGLTERQIDVLKLILNGLPNKLICRQLQLAEGTVKVHVSAVLRALGVRSRTQAVVAAGRLGLRFDNGGARPLR